MSLRHHAAVRSAVAHPNLEMLEPRRLFAAADLDPTFGGGDGQAVVPIADAASARVEVAARQADGKILIAGSRQPVGAAWSATKLNLLRLESDGDLDPTFGGGDGLVELDLDVSAIMAISVDPSSGRIALSTTSGTRVFEANGDAVAAFDSVGGYAAVYQADGKLLVASMVTQPDPIYGNWGEEQTAIELRRYNTDGSLDDSFGVAGARQIALSSVSLVPWHERDESFAFDRMVIGTDGSIYVSAHRTSYFFVDNGTSLYGDGLSIFRLTANGEIDQSFGPNGQVNVHTETNAGDVRPMALEAAPGGGVTAVWSVVNGSGTDYPLAFYVKTLKSDGTLNAALYAGKLQLPSAVNRADWMDFGVDASGRLLLSGVYAPTDSGNHPSLFAARFMPSGLPDYSYDDDGIYLAGPNALGDWKAATLVLPDGSVLLAGSRPDGQPVGFVVSKLQGGEGTPSPTPTIALNAKGTLMVTTTDAKDLVSLSIRQSDGRLILRSGTFAQSFAVSKVKRIALYTLGGDDVVTIGPGVRGSYVEAGDGTDTLNGGQLGDVLLGGLGGDQIFGNDGDDTLLGEGGNDYLLGGAGKDDLFGNGGTDTLSGAGGNDRLFGGPSEADRILGGAGADSAAQDDKDSYESIETLLSA
jgi:uncharacterized delta-60 repeat protein